MAANKPIAVQTASKAEMQLIQPTGFQYSVRSEGQSRQMRSSESIPRLGIVCFSDLWVLQVAFARGLLNRNCNKANLWESERQAKVINPEANALQQVSGILLRAFSRSPAVPRPEVSIIKMLSER